MKLYTKRGDSGATDLFGGQRVDKDALRVEAYGTVDELNSVLGLAASGCPSPQMQAILVSLQSRLFEIGADLATPRKDSDEDKSIIPRITMAQVEQMEQMIDAACADVPEMKSFVLPGGTELAARLHLARTVCRRAERVCVALHKREPIGDAVIVYLNRLSDLLFAMARQANHEAGVADVPWVSPKRK